MKVPRIFSKGKRKYKFLKRCNRNVFLYEDIINGFKVCFDRFELGLIEERKDNYNIKPEKVIF